MDSKKPRKRLLAGLKVLRLVVCYCFALDQREYLRGRHSLTAKLGSERCDTALQELDDEVECYESARWA